MLCQSCCSLAGTVRKTTTAICRKNGEAGATERIGTDEFSKMGKIKRANVDYEKPHDGICPDMKKGTTTPGKRKQHIAAGDARCQAGNAQAARTSCNKPPEDSGDAEAGFSFDIRAFVHVHDIQRQAAERDAAMEDGDSGSDDDLYWDNGIKQDKHQHLRNN